MATNDWRVQARDILANNPNYRKYAGNVARRPAPGLRADAAAAAPTDPGPSEIQKYYTTGQGGNIIFVTTVKEETSLSDDVKKVFSKCSVLMAAITKALGTDANLYEFDKYDNMIRKSGYFLPLDLQDSTAHVAVTNVTVDVAILGQVVGIAGAPEAAAALKGIISTLGGQINVAVTQQNDSKKVAKMILWLEEIMGVPLASIQIFYVVASEASTAVKTPCTQVATSAFDLKYHMQGYMFVDPAWIDQFSADFQSSPAFDDLVKRLQDASKATDPTPTPPAGGGH